MKTAVECTEGLRCRKATRVASPSAIVPHCTNGTVTREHTTDDPETSMPDFPIQVLPVSLRDFAVECARVSQVPVGLSAACALAVVSAALGSRLRVRSIHGKTLPANIMLLAAAETGSGKSEVFRQCMAPFEACQSRATQHWEERVLPGARAEARLLAAELKGLESKAKGKGANRDLIKREMTEKEANLAIARALLEPPVFRASDFTTPQLIRLLCRMDGQMFAASSDAKNFVDMVLGRYNEGGTDEEVYLKGFSLEPIDRHRVGDGSQETPEACIAGLWLTQPDKLQRLLAERALSEGGLLPRMLLLEVRCAPLRVSTSETGISSAATACYETTISALFQTFRNSMRVAQIDADDDARQRLVDYHNTIADRRELELRDVSGFAARWGEYAWRLALVCRAARLGKDVGEAPLALEDAEAGIALADWFALQQLTVLQAGRVEAQNERYSKVLNLFGTKPTVVARDVYRAGITPRDETRIAAALLEEMERVGLLVHEDRSTERKNHVQRVYSRTTAPRT